MQLPPRANTDLGPPAEHILERTEILPCVRRVGIDDLHDDEGVQEMGRYHVGGERRVFLLENDRHDVVADVPLPLQLLRVVLGVGQERGDVEHDLPLLEDLVDRRVSRVAVLYVQTTPATTNFEIHSRNFN